MLKIKPYLTSYIFWSGFVGTCVALEHSYKTTKNASLVPTLLEHH